MFISVKKGVDLLKKHNIIIYPTESVFGIGCDPESLIAVNRLLLLKKRDINKGFVLVSCKYSQIERYVDTDKLNMNKKKLYSYWKRKETILLPSTKYTPYWITGNTKLVAIRISTHKTIQELCHYFNRPIISTSANLSGKKPCRTIKDLKKQFGKKLYIVRGQLGTNKKPSNIINSITYKYIRYE